MSTRRRLPILCRFSLMIWFKIIRFLFFFSKFALQTWIFICILFRRKIENCILGFRTGCTSEKLKTLYLLRTNSFRFLIEGPNLSLFHSILICFECKIYQKMECKKYCQKICKTKIIRKNYQTFSENFIFFNNFQEKSLSFIYIQYNNWIFNNWT